MQKHNLQTKKKMKRFFFSLFFFNLSANQATKGKYQQAQNQERQILS
jgi:hypothetical protein